MDGPTLAQPPETAANNDLALIAALCAGRVAYMTEGQQQYIFMEGLKFLAKGVQKQMNALLCLNWPNPLYPTKLLLAENIGLNLNWNEQPYALGRAWFTWSWTGVSPNQPPAHILAEHLGAFQ